MYIGNAPGENFISISKQVFTIVNSQTAYSLDFPVESGNDIRLVINNVVQQAGSGKAYTASGQTLTLSEALTNGTDEMYCVFLGKARETVTVPTITKDKVDFISDATGSGVISKGDGSSIDGSIQLNCHVNSHGIKLKSPPHSAGASYTLTFPNSISADKFLKTDGSGNLSFASAGIAEADMWRLNTNYTIPSSGSAINSGFERVDNATFAKIGTGMTQSSGTWTFPQTGLYHVKFNASRIRSTSGDFNAYAFIYGTSNNSSYEQLSQGAESVNPNYSVNFGSISIDAFFNCTNTSTHKVQFWISGGTGNSAQRLDGDSDSSYNSFLFFRLGDSQ